jgi:hypothetical protein
MQKFSFYQAYPLLFFRVLALENGTETAEMRKYPLKVVSTRNSISIVDCPYQTLYQRTIETFFAFVKVKRLLQVFVYSGGICIGNRFQGEEERLPKTYMVEF